ncbi:DEAD/DEAH box helicase [Demequina sp. TTPB684]|uniref:DEAD/DEAH box helicase n=1 Tax=unclassified Demequina TaxID=2620311 RepID=UPI001CF28115|nr:MULTISPECIES: DEAD/DEAH box helicase [unclassified Demequina]MCB2412327.1 DEAD/DEAH box helicase [Demequina sp. TTPB684]UPU89478.1 DEAD/DEAH box helicase [Demequina sp. TMPB413]
MSSSFAELGVPTQLTDVLEREGKTKAFPIQEDTLPDTLAGSDVLGRGKTGSGKTLAFSLPIVARLGRSGGKSRPGRPRALVLAPTRELATQIDAVIAPLAKAYGLTTTTIFGGVSQQRQERALRAGVDIVVACPGRLEDLMKQRHVTLDAVEMTVLDEADHMADLGFLPGVTRIMTATPARGQRLLFSATLDNGVDKLVRQFLTNPITHSVDNEDSHVEAMTHHVFHVGGADAKRELVHALASGTGRRILFMRTKHQAKKLAKQLTEAGIPSVDLHGNLSQGQRDRNLALFQGDTHRVLVATDVAARGVHVDNVELVVHVDPPAEHKAYLHRSGRTARAGSAGDVVTVVLPEQRRETDQLLRRASIQVRPQAVSASSAQVASLVGETAPYVKPVPVADQPQRQGGAPGRGRRRGAGGAAGAPRQGQSAGRSAQGRSSEVRSADGRSSQARPAQARTGGHRGGHGGAAAFSASGSSRRRSR